MIFRKTLVYFDSMLSQDLVAVGFLAVMAADNMAEI